VYWKKDDKLCWRFFDVISSKEKQTNVFVESAWRQMMKQHQEFFQDFDHFIVWSDGGPQHFKVIKTMGFFANFHNEFNKKIEYNFFASYHGKSECDAHAGVMKRAITQSKLEYHRITNEASVAQVTKHLKSTEIMILENPVSKFATVEFDGPVKKWHKFQYVGNNRVSCFLHSESNKSEEFNISFTTVETA
jgi:hypothetical protein